MTERCLSAGSSFTVHQLSAVSSKRERRKTRKRQREREREITPAVAALPTSLREFLQTRKLEPASSRTLPLRSLMPAGTRPPMLRAGKPAPARPRKQTNDWL
ncbi:hypothetical protein VUR80DRAFT_9226 [Thermomyces stellatus]